MRKRGSEMKVKLNKAELIKAIETKLKNERLRFQQESLASVEENKAARKQYVNNLLDFAKFVKEGGEIPTDSYKLERIVEKGCAFPKEPTKVSDKYEKALKRLSLVVDDVIQTTDENEYLDLI